LPSAQDRPAQGPPEGRPPRDLRYVRAFLRNARIVLGPRATLPIPEEARFDRALAQEVAAAARKQTAQALLAEAISTGVGLDQALLTTMRSLIDAGEWHSARALVEGVGRLDGTGKTGRLGRLLAAHPREWVDLTWQELSGLDDETVATLLPVEAVETCFRLNDPSARERARAIAAHAELMSAHALVDLAGRFLAMGEPEQCRQLVRELGSRDEMQSLDESRAHALAVLDRWLSPAECPPVPAGSAVIAVMDYDQPDQSRASRNVGDYIQTLAMLGNLARHSDMVFTGGDGLGELMADLQARVRPELRTGGTGGQAHLISINRDFSTVDAVPPGTFAIAFGWHMHSLFGLRYDFPYHPNLRPIFISVHVNRPEMLTPEAIDYLRTYGPVGCRDWPTVDLLLSAGVDAFFSGCLTTTVDAVFRPTSAVPRVDSRVAVIDAPPAAAADVRGVTEIVSHGGHEVRLAGLAEGVRAAIALLERYQTHYGHVVTGRLHSYLPATSLGLPVTFVPAQPADPRFDGLWDLTPDSPRFQAIRDGIRDLLAEVLPLVVAGRDESEVYGRWREMTAPLVDQARERFDREPPSPPPLPGLLDAVAEIRAAGQRYGPHDAVDPAAVTDIALSLDQNLTRQLPVTLEAMFAHASGPLRLWITCRGLDSTYQAWVAAAFPQAPMTFLPCDTITYGDSIGRLIEHTTITTIDRLLLPELLPDVERVTYIDIDAVVLGDVCALAATDLGGNALAARTASRLEAQVWRRTGSLIPQHRAFELWHRMSSRHSFGPIALNAGILVLDLERMRSDSFTETYVPWVGWYGMNDQDVLLAYVGGDRAPLEPRWNAWPVMDVLDDPAIVHYLGSAKPWTSTLAPGRQIWEHWEKVSRERVGLPPEPTGTGAADG
jgi:lipopolysaccharide biosynthesis glycosyltransferase